ncbi:MAG: hypothetical protein ABFD64_06795 [Armatimonadota bacterium]
MGRVTIRKIIEKVHVDNPDALEMVDVEFIRLFNECARNEFSVSEPESKWQFWSIERARKAIKAEKLGGLKERDKRRFLLLLDQYRKAAESIYQMPTIFSISTSHLQDIWEAVNKERNNEIETTKKMIKEAESIDHTAKEGKIFSAKELKTLEDVIKRARIILKKTTDAAEKAIPAQQAMKENILSTSEHVYPSAFVYLIAILDSFIADTLRFIYTMHPHQMQTKFTQHTRKENAELKRVDYQTIFQSGSYSALINHIVEQEVGLVTNRNITLQFTAMENCGIDLSKIDKLDAVEITATRNIYVHNAGKVNEIYLDTTKEYWSALKKRTPFKIGQVRPIDKDYFEHVGPLIEGVLIAVKEFITP